MAESSRSESYIEEHRASIEEAFSDAMAAVMDAAPEHPIPFIAKFLAAHHPEPIAKQKNWSSPLFFSEESMEERLAAAAAAGEGAPKAAR